MNFADSATITYRITATMHSMQLLAEYFSQYNASGLIMQPTKVNYLASKLLLQRTIQYFLWVAYISA